MRHEVSVLTEAELRGLVLLDLEMVDLERLNVKAEEQFVRFMIERHVNYTDSDFARAVLGDWERNRARFVKVMPLDYRRALEERSKSQVAQHG